MKRILDIILSVILLVFTMPIILSLSIIIWFVLGRPIFFRQERPGINGVIFELIKFRSMSNKLDSSGNLSIDSERLNWFGKLLRSSSLDELPELWNVLKGDMSFVGPRPALFNQDDLIDLRLENGLDKLIPGLTGWAQVNGRDELSIPEKVLLEVEYMQKKHFGLI